MANQFCISCGHSLALDAKFCDNCGAVFHVGETSVLDTFNDETTTNPTPQGTTHEAVIKHARLAVTSWVIPFNATLVFGSTLVAVFDFLSPRIALLPIAATVAVVGLLTALALRKFVAPSLPEASAFRRVLAPGASLHKSPMLIATGLLSALMVSGAAWSSVNVSEGGVIASKFDAARVAQMQTGILQGMQKEQRQQTGVLEDIREGRAVDPRRELSNIGGGFSGYELDAALDRSDTRTVRLLLAGGLKWRIENAYAPFANSNPKMTTLLLENMDSFELRAGDCERLIEQRFGANKQYEMVNGVMQPAISLPGLSPSELAPFQKKLLKTFCAKPEVQAFVKDKLQIKKIEAGRTQKISLEATQATERSRETCIKNTTSERENRLDMQRIRRKVNYKFTCISSDCTFKDDRLTLALNDDKKYAEVVRQICSEEYPIFKEKSKGNADTSAQTYQNILDAIS